jgi:hypothetical protein
VTQYKYFGTTVTNKSLIEENIWTKRNEVMSGWRKPHNEELHNLYSSPSIIRMIKSRRMKWVGHVARMGAKRNAYRILVGNQKERDH